MTDTYPPLFGGFLLVSRSHFWAAGPAILPPKMKSLSLNIRRSRLAFDSPKAQESFLFIEKFPSKYLEMPNSFILYSK